ncbi:hypothetical protein SAMN05880501_105112 [Ureibacillus xyleni]|uniref:Uncharacterized protein n=1 Tax=Ureibacillus xyleni TaxID=614648 RepID=A0A285SKW2_9BACL|nr:hypothetical protein [Ureibacillus xyleni]SOC08606.1 hypothetical protein SAMN05880501_105112 [Ureibacillus xyleni]
MLYVRHTVGSRLFFETNEYQIKPVDNEWEISFSADKESANNLLQFHDELNIFHVEGEHQKTWYYSSEGIVHFDKGNNTISIFADHKTVYPV